MKKLIKLSVLLVAVTCLCSCYVNKVYAPAGEEVTLANAGEKMDVTVEKKQWYALWGLVPITEDRTSEIIDTYGFDEVKVESKITFIDFVIGIFTGVVSIVPSTTVVEGNNTDGQ